MALTEYVVLEADRERGGWILSPTKVMAHSARQAVAQHVAALKDEGGEYEGEFVATPARSWSPVTVQTETQTKIKFS